MSCTTASRRPRIRFTSVDLPTLGRPTTATTGGGAYSASRSPTSIPSGGSSQSPSSDQVPSASASVSLIAVLSVLGAGARRCFRVRLPLLDEVEKVCYNLGFGHVTAVDDDRVSRRPAGATPPASSPGGPGDARRPAPRRSPRVEPVETFWSLRRRARSSADAVRKIFTSASGSTTVPMSRPSTTTVTDPSASSRCRSTSRVRTSGTADTAETAFVTASPRISAETSSPPRK